MNIGTFFFSIFIFLSAFSYVETTFASSVDSFDYLFDINDAKLNHFEQNEKSQLGSLYLTGEFVSSPCKLLTNEIFINQLLTKKIEVEIFGCDALIGDFNQREQKTPFFNNLGLTNPKLFKINSEFILAVKSDEYNNLLFSYSISDLQLNKIIESKTSILTFFLDYN